jgi:hypothetical protein
MELLHAVPQQRTLDSRLAKQEEISQKNVRSTITPFYMVCKWQFSISFEEDKVVGAHTVEDDSTTLLLIVPTPFQANGFKIQLAF